MNYRHAFHAGNFADVVKHTVLARIVNYLKRKDGAFRVIDTHAGAGLYRLDSDAAAKTDEWRGGIGRLFAAALPDDAKLLLAPYLDAVQAANQAGNVTRYPGSPVVIRHLLRKQDRLTAIEKHPAEAAALKARFAGDFQARVLELDGWLAFASQLPPKERRGLVFTDPPFEEPGEFQRFAEGLAKAQRRWPGGIYAFWYPVKDRKAVARFRKALAATELDAALDISLLIRPPSPDERLDGCGLVVVNPPYVLAGELAVILPVLAGLLAEDGRGGWALDWLRSEDRRAPNGRA